ncbi:hypothetical protein [Minwuia sp.]|uniref:hypothetical protein n=1 Tax=Minwuia sp. TaxID=2493630 RepID=UPI003A8DB448
MPDCVVMKGLRDIQPMVASFAVIAMLLHAAFWVSCALQFPPGTVSTAQSSFLIPICTPDGIEVRSIDFAGEADASGDGNATPSECPACSLVCGTDVQTAEAGLLLPASLTERLPAAIIEADFEASLLARSAISPRAPPVSVATI